MSFYRVETGSAGFRACPLGLVLDSGVGSKGPWLAKFCIADPGFPIILRVVKGKGGAGGFCFGGTGFQVTGTLKVCLDLRKIMKKMFRFLLWMLLLTAALGFAQSTTGIVPYSSYTPHQYDTISNADLGMTVTAPVRSKGGPIPFQANLVLNHNVSISGGSTQVIPYFALLIAGTGATSFLVTHSTCPYQPPNPPGPTDLYHGFKFTDDTGAVHDYSTTIKFDTAGCLNNDETTDAIETNGSGLHGIVATNPDGSFYFEVTDLNGNVIGGNTLVTDANGNTLSGTLTVARLGHTQIQWGRLR